MARLGDEAPQVVLRRWCVPFAPGPIAKRAIAPAGSCAVPLPVKPDAVTGQERRLLGQGVGGGARPCGITSCAPIGGSDAQVSFGGVISHQSLGISHQDQCQRRGWPPTEAETSREVSHCVSWRLARGQSPTVRYSFTFQRVADRASTPGQGGSMRTKGRGDTGDAATKGDRLKAELRTWSLYYTGVCCVFSALKTLHRGGATAGSDALPVG